MPRKPGKVVKISEGSLREKAVSNKSAYQDVIWRVLEALHTGESQISEAQIESWAQAALKNAKPSVHNDSGSTVLWNAYQYGREVMKEENSKFQRLNRLYPARASPVNLQADKDIKNDVSIARLLKLHRHRPFDAKPSKTTTCKKSQKIPRVKSAPGRLQSMAVPTDRLHRNREVVCSPVTDAPKVQYDRQNIEGRSVFPDTNAPESETTKDVTPCQLPGLSLFLPLKPSKSAVQELCENGFQVLQEIAVTQFSAVYLVQHDDSPVQWVAKAVDLRQLTRIQASQALLEAELMRRLKSPFIVEYKESFVTDDFLIIVMEYCESGNLWSYLQTVFCDSESERREMRVPEDLVIKWMSHLTAGLKDMHEKNILHCDLKTANIFLKSDYQVAKIGDLGIAQELRKGAAILSPHRCPRGTPLYMSPEMCSRRAVSERSDCWALGCILYEICNLDHAFPSQLTIWHQGEELLLSPICLGTKLIRAVPAEGISDETRKALASVLTGASDLSLLSKQMLTNIATDLKKMHNMGVLCPSPTGLSLKTPVASKQMSIDEENTAIYSNADTTGSTNEECIAQLIPSSYQRLLNYLVCALLNPIPVRRPTLSDVAEILTQCSLINVAGSSEFSPASYLECPEAMKLVDNKPILDLVFL